MNRAETLKQELPKPQNLNPNNFNPSCGSWGSEFRVYRLLFTTVWGYRNITEYPVIQNKMGSLLVSGSCIILYKEPTTSKRAKGPTGRPGIKIDPGRKKSIGFYFLMVPLRNRTKSKFSSIEGLSTRTSIPRGS